MTAREQPDQQALNHVFLADDCAVHLGDQLFDKAAFVSDFLIDFVDVCSDFHRFLSSE